MKNLILYFAVAGLFLSADSFAEATIRIKKDIVLRANIDRYADLGIELRPYSQVDYTFSIFSNGVLETDRRLSPVDTAQMPSLTLYISAMNDGENQQPDRIVLKAGLFKIKCGVSITTATPGNDTWKSVSQYFSLDPSPILLLSKDLSPWKNAWSEVAFESTNFAVKSTDTSCDAIIKNNLEQVFRFNMNVEFLRGNP